MTPQQWQKHTMQDCGVCGSWFPVKSDDSGTKICRRCLLERPGPHGGQYRDKGTALPSLNLGAKLRAASVVLWHLEQACKTPNLNR